MSLGCPGPLRWPEPSGPATSPRGSIIPYPKEMVYTPARGATRWRVGWTLERLEAMARILVKDGISCTDASREVVETWSLPLQGV